MESESGKDWPKFGEFDGKRFAKECLDSTLVGTLATHGPKGSWSAALYFTYDDDFNIYFVSLRGDRHMQNIIEDNEVGFSAFMPLDKSKGEEIQVQIDGFAVPVEREGIDKVYAQRERRLLDGSWKPEPNETLRVEMTGAMFMKIRTQGLYYVNSGLFGGDRRLVPLDLTK